MKVRRFRAFAEKEDLQAVFQEFQNRLEVYYVPTYSDMGKVSFDDVTGIDNLGINFYGSHIGNMQILAFFKNTSCLDIDLNGIYQEDAIFPTEISTMYYDEEAAKKLYDELKKIFRKQAVKTIQGYYICPKAYEHKEKYRFCTIDIKSPPEYDLKVL